MKLVKTLIGLLIGIICIPALYMLAVTLFGTVLACIAQPRVMIVLLGVLAVISVPGGVIVWLVKK